MKSDYKMYYPHFFDGPKLRLGRINLLQKSIASQKPNTSHPSRATIFVSSCKIKTKEHRMRVFFIRFANFYKYKSIINQPNATHRSVVIACDATIFCVIANFMLPKRRTWTVRFWRTFRVCEYSFWSTTDWKLVQKRIRNALFNPRKFFVWGA
jgi:hypothetical protein